MRAHGYALHAPGAPLEAFDYELEAPGADEAVVRVAGCGLCHTDLAFYSGEVKTRRGLPLVLGHEVAGVVEDAGPRAAHLLGRKVIVPAVLPCGECDPCRAGLPNICARQFMPGNDGHGGFASHLKVPARDLAVLPDALRGHELADLSVIADAVTTPYQAIVRSGLKAGDLAIVVGVGGIGTYGVQIAKALGAKVIALDIDDAKLARIGTHGADFTLNVQTVDPKSIKKAVRELAQAARAPQFGWRIFEMSGTKGGQELAYGLLGPAATLSVVGFTMATLELRLSNLMAFDARCIGNWGCAPALYADAIRLVLEGKVTLRPFIEKLPLGQIQHAFEEARAGRLAQRAILVPEG
jgi:6-hydroxycyclohex-1-ene-1-carbonyl-CoA dehydrogenase